MKYTCEITIDLPRERVVEIFDDSEKLPKWMPGLKRFEHLSGDPGQPGAKSRLVFEQRGGTREMIETVTRRDLPGVFAGTYETGSAWNQMANRLSDDGPNRTRWAAENDFRFSGFMKFAGVLLRPLFPRQTMKFMRAFKEFAETSAGEPREPDSDRSSQLSA